MKRSDSCQENQQRQQLADEDTKNDNARGAGVQQQQQQQEEDRLCDCTMPPAKTGSLLHMSSPAHNHHHYHQNGINSAKLSLTPATMASQESSPTASEMGEDEEEMTSFDSNSNNSSSGGNPTAGDEDQQQQQRRQQRQQQVNVGTTMTAAASFAATNKDLHDNRATPQKAGNMTWVPMPSPSRPRLDPRYAARLAPVFWSTASSSSISGTTPQRRLSSSSSSSSTSTSMDAAADSALMPPPGITRDCDASFSFRPTPILTQLDTLHHDEHEEPYFTSTSTSSSSFSSASSASSGAAFPPPTPGRMFFAGQNSSRRATKQQVLADVGASDRFVASRATSSLEHVNLWPRRSTTSTTSNINGNGSGNNNGINNGNMQQPGTPEAAAIASGAVSPWDVEVSAPSAAAHSQQSLLNTLLRSELLGESEHAAAAAAASAAGGGGSFGGPYYAGGGQSSSPSSATSSSSGPSATAGPAAGMASAAAGAGSGSATQGRNNGAGGRAAAWRSTTLQPTSGPSHFRFRSPRQAYQENVFESSVGPTAIVNSFGLTPVRSAASQRLMAAPPKRKRRISKVPFKVLDAPALQDDFYLNLVDWSSQNVLAVGLGSCVYLWSACTSKVTKLCDMEAAEDIVTSVAWAQRGTHLAVGTNRGEVQLWDTIRSKRVRSMNGHSARVGALAWTGPCLASGGRDRLIYLRDVRVQAAYTNKLSNHKQEVCGLKWSFDEPSFLASGGNDNHLHVIDSRHAGSPIHRFSDHTAAVKAITWSPHQHGLLASGGGTADRCIRFWNTLSGTSLNKIDTGSQVCNIAWSQNCNEIVSTHGYSLNQIVVWRYPSMSKVVTLTGHTYRVLYLAMSPDGSTVVTGAGDETLRFWQIFPGPRSGEKDNAGGLLFPNTLGSVIR